MLPLGREVSLASTSRFRRNAGAVQLTLILGEQPTGVHSDQRRLILGLRNGKGTPCRSTGRSSALVFEELTLSCSSQCLPVQTYPRGVGHEAASKTIRAHRS